MSLDDDSAAAAALPAVAEKCCASCGIAEIDDIKLKPCPHCDLVGYCSDQCLQDHSEKHEPICKERAAELFDELLFKQPESSHLGDCPICFLPMPIDLNDWLIQSCCGTMLCCGCASAQHVHNLKGRLVYQCPFCRNKKLPNSEEEMEKNYLERAKSNDLIALGELGRINFNRENYSGALKYWSRAAALDDVESVFNLSVMYREGKGVKEDKDKERALLEKAAIAGHPSARCNLGCIEANNGRVDRAVAHWIIAAAQGHEKSIKALKLCYEDGHVRKEDFAASLRAHQAAVDAMKSPQRWAAELWDAYYNEQNAGKI